MRCRRLSRLSRPPSAFGKIQGLSKQNLRSPRRNNRQSKQVARSFVSLGSKPFRLKLSRCCSVTQGAQPGGRTSPRAALAHRRASGHNAPPSAPRSSPPCRLQVLGVDQARLWPNSARGRLQWRTIKIETVVKTPGLSSPCTMECGERLLTAFGLSFTPHI